jgi:hypothetical protein
MLHQEKIQKIKNSNESKEMTIKVNKQMQYKKALKLQARTF